MFIVIDNLQCTTDTPFDRDIDNIINAGIMHIFQDINRYDFYMFDEASTENVHNNLDGTQLYDNAFKPTTINWCATNNRLTFMERYNTDIFPISTLKCVLDNVTLWNDINVNGNVVVIDTELYSVYYYNIIDNIIHKHRNKSIDLTKFYDLSIELYDNRVPRDEEFIDILQKSFPQCSYVEILEEYGIIYFMKVLIANV